MGKRSRELKLRLQHSIVGQVAAKGVQSGQALKAYRKAKPILEHAEHCPRCQDVFNRIKYCPSILELPNGSFKEANTHIMEHLPCRMALKEILECPLYEKAK